MKTLTDALAGNSYPGRGILLGLSACGEWAYIAYFIMGRSVNSRNRIFVCDGDDVRTKAYDESKLSDPSLIIYAPLRVFDKQTTVVTNGDQTDTICDALALGGSFESALRTREFEPDGPNFTPRISGLLRLRGEQAAYALSILKSSDGGQSCERFFYEYAQPTPGQGHLIHTYQGDGNPLPSFVGEPVRVALEGDFQHLANQLWQVLDEDNKVSLLVRRVQLKTGRYEQIIFNKNQ